MSIVKKSISIHLEVSHFVPQKIILAKTRNPCFKNPRFSYVAPINIDTPYKRQYYFMLLIVKHSFMGIEIF